MLKQFLVMLMLTSAPSALADPCPDETEAGTLDAFIRPGTDELKKVAHRRSARVTVTDEGGHVVAQGEGDLSDLHRFKLQPGTYRLRVEGEGLRTIIKQGVVVVGRKTTESKTFVVAEGSN